MKSFTPLKAVLGALALTASTIVPAPVASQTPEIACGTLYKAKSGDTLHKIAVLAYGTGEYGPVFQANRDLLPNPSSLQVGQQLLIPCRDGSGPQTRADALASAADAAAPAADNTAPAPEITLAAVVADADVNMLTGSDFAPFSDQRLPEGGMVTELVKLALDRAAPEHPAKVTFVNDWSRHLDLLGSGAFEIGFPWYKPDCTQAERLSESIRARCTGFVFSDPIYAVSMGYYVRSGDALTAAETHDALEGKRLCRPAGYFTFDLDQADLREPRVTRVVPPTAADCFTLLMQGEVDVISLSASLAEPQISRLGLVGHVVEARQLATSQTLHAVASESSPEGRAYIEMLNAGIADLLSSGRWFEVASRHLGAFGMTLR
ncbi:MAG TPA: transporter substrate-binding domain-containing protein [Thermohalobaculum sp.]|nr:transporter substrate-binding domain-containing protein [Thermohalobaculum sp.]